MGRHPILDVVKSSTGAVAFYEALRWNRIGSVEIELDSRPSLSTWIYATPGLFTDGPSDPLVTGELGRPSYSEMISLTADCEHGHSP